MSFSHILENYRRIAFTERDKGYRFERLMQAYLRTDPQYAYRFKKVWLWNEFPGNQDFGGKETGIDLVALTNDGDYWAIQCKCLLENAIIDKPAVDSFLATSSRQFKDENLKTTGFAHRLWISTTNKWGANAAEAIKNQVPPVSRISLYNLQEAPVDWIKLEQGISGDSSRAPKKELRPHQKQAVDKTIEAFRTVDRGKLIMACGTGKTFAALRIAETLTDGQGLILFLVPSIALLGQTLREWSADAKEPINAVCICSDPEVSRKKNVEDDASGFSIIDLALPASTDVRNIRSQFAHIRDFGSKGMTVVFSTYQSIKVIAQAQKQLLNDKHLSIFDLIICDEAHRTTGVTLSTDEDSSEFVKVHDNDFIQAKKRLYMTATPRLYSDDAKSKAAQSDAVLCSMDDPVLYGDEIYRIGFGVSVEQNLLSDYKVLILTLSETDVPPVVQQSISSNGGEINTDDAVKLIGCINALSKQIIGDDGTLKAADPEPMRRAVAFCQSIAISKKITTALNAAADPYLVSLPPDKQENMVNIESQHIDGTMSAPTRDDLLGWLKSPADDPKACRVLTNVRCLSEGVDVPSLDAVMFLSARNSQIDVVQSVGRVMRKSTGKNYGYIIIPIVIPADVEPDKALDDNERYKVVWTVLNALRAHDDRFNATVNKIELNKKKPVNILVGRPDVSSETEKTNDQSAKLTERIGRQLALQFAELQNIVFARLVQKVGDRRYWEQWAKDVAQIAERFISRINLLIAEAGEHQQVFADFLRGLQKNINPSITAGQAVEMLAQHIITKPVFEALFEGYSFVQNNAVSQSMQRMIDLLEAQSVEQDTETLHKFYQSVKSRAAGIDNAEGKQRIIIELYDKFFKTAFPKMVEQLGIVYTPVECVDFIIRSVNDILQQEFGRTLSDENVHILDPFTGTGTFMVRLLQSGLIRQHDLERKYRHELHANEIVLLAYYIAAVNIENAYHDATPDPDDGMGTANYTPFDGIVLTDTFQLGETEEAKLFSEMFPKNSERVLKQKKAPITVIIGNPPYSVGQRSANDNAQNQKYNNLDKRVEETYARGSKATSVKALYDAYIKAFRWSTDRLDSKHGGVIAFISNGGWLDSNGMDGFRKNLEKEFTSIWVLNLRGNARTSGELRQKEAGNVFGGGTRTPITITFLVKNPAAKTTKAVIHYHDIGDYLNREQKLEIVKKFAAVSNPEMHWLKLQPNEHGDWISQRSDSFENFIPLESVKKFDAKSITFFVSQSLGIISSRDSWVYNSSKKKLLSNIKRSVNFYNNEVKRFISAQKDNSKLIVSDVINNDATQISWSSSLIPHVEKGTQAIFEKECIVTSIYRPFFKQFLYHGDKMIHRRGQLDCFFPNLSTENYVICVPGAGGNKDFSALISDCIPDFHFNGDVQAFPLCYYEQQNRHAPTLWDADDKQYIRRDGVSDFILQRAQRQYGKNVTKEDIFYYVYSFLHSPDYRAAFANDLKKQLPRLPLVEDVSDFWAFSKAGRRLADLHIHYESVPPAPGVVVLYNRIPKAQIEKALSGEDLAAVDYLVQKMRFLAKDRKDVILYNSQITVENIPAQAYDYVVNGKSAIEWIMERYQITTHKDSGIINDPNDWAEEVGNPKYILDLLLSIINVSLQTVEIVAALPKVKYET